ncbi:MAG TPA: hypothetical protein VGV89_02575 [Thermoplasmata archaeon]|nr:hypothetical protein [Thermoplasmata archaeon]
MLAKRVAREELDAVARLADPARHDRYSEHALERSLEEYRTHRRDAVGPFTITVDGVPVVNLYRALSDPARAFGELLLARTGAEPESARWEFLRPLDRITIAGDGTALLERGGSAPVRVVVRLVLREHYVPMPAPSAKSAPAASRSAPRPELFTPATLAKYVRASGVVPYALAIAVYFPEERVRYEVDLVENVLLVDPRARSFPPSGRVARPSRMGHAIDALVARGELTMPSARALEVVAESNGLTAVDVAPLFGGVRELGTSALDSLVSRRLVTFDRRTGLYRPRLEALTSSSERPRERTCTLAPRSNPRLRTSVMELLAAADSRASCPLCGDPLPSGWKGLLCAKCQSLVGDGSPGARPA